MRWFKHMTSSADDERLSRLMDRVGLEGYGFWWRVVEIVARKLDETGRTSVVYSPQKWAGMIGIRSDKFRRLADECATIGLFRINSCGDSFEIDIPNLLKFRDEYTKKSGQTPDKIRSKKQIQNTDTDKDTPQPPAGGTETGGEDSLTLRQRGTNPRAAPPVARDDTQPPLLSPEDMDMGFQQFIAAYPDGHVQPVGGAIQAWCKLQREGQLPGLPRLLDGVTAWEESEQWQKEGGRFIPSAENFLRKRMWLGSPPRASPAGDLSGAIERMHALAKKTNVVTVPG